MDEKHILISLGDEKIKHIGEVIGSKSCNKILDILTEGEATESEISKKLKMPLNTVGYNIKKLMKAKLIEKSNHWWSVKGKKMPTYKISNRKIIISPKKPITKAFAWTIGLTGLAALTIRQFTKKTSSEILTASRDLILPLEERVFSENAEATTTLLKGTQQNLEFFTNLGPWSWFLLGAWFAVLLFFILTIYSERRNKR